MGANVSGHVAILSKAHPRGHGLEFCVLVPASPCGLSDNLDLQVSHVIPARIDKYVAAQECDKAQVVRSGARAGLRASFSASMAPPGRSSHRPALWTSFGTSLMLVAGEPI